MPKNWLGKVISHICFAQRIDGGNNRVVCLLLEKRLNHGINYPSPSPNEIVKKWKAKMEVFYHITMCKKTRVFVYWIGIYSLFCSGGDLKQVGG